LEGKALVLTEGSSLLTGPLNSPSASNIVLFQESRNNVLVLILFGFGFLNKGPGPGTLPNTFPFAVNCGRDPWSLHPQPEDGLDFGLARHLLSRSL
jgi:hypothetical protein